MLATANHHPAAVTASARHHLHVVALRAADDVRQTDLAGQAHSNAHRVIAAVQCPHPRLQRLPCKAAASGYRLARIMIRVPPRRDQNRSDP